MNAYEQMRAALMQVSLSCSACPRHNCKGCTRPFASFMPAVRKALVLPRRNCEVGTEEEQSKRFEAFCSLHHLPKGKGCYSCPAIPTRSPLAFHRNACKINWAQMPYEQEGGAKWEVK